MLTLTDSRKITVLYLATAHTLFINSFIQYVDALLHMHIINPSLLLQTLGFMKHIVSQ